MRSPRLRPRSSGRPSAIIRMLAAALALGATSLHAARSQAHALAAPPPGVIETGVPPFTGLGPEALGLNSAPTELKLLPDGRVIAVALRQIALGDGVRWEVFELPPEDGDIGIVESVLVDPDGTIFAPQDNAVFRIVFGTDGHWRRELVAKLPPLPNKPNPALGFAMHAAGKSYFTGVSGTVSYWKDRSELRLLGITDFIGRIFEAGGQAYVSDRANGRLFRCTEDRLEPVLPEVTVSGEFGIHGATPLPDGRTLVCTFGHGLMIFDGRSLVAAAAPPPLGGEYHLADVCAVAGGYYAAAVEDLGVVFFDRDLRVVQTVDAAADHRLARIRRLVPGAAGQLWILLGNGIARIEFPSRVSRFETLVEKGFSFAYPYRHEGELWLCTDGVTHRGVYDAQGRLLRTVPDSPANRYIYNLVSVPELGLLLGATAQGLHVRRDGRWTELVPGLLDSRLYEIGEPRRWLYCARGEIGFLRHTGDGFAVERTPVPGLDVSYGGVRDDDGIVWVELGSGRCGRIDVRAPRLGIQLFGPEHGLAQSWVQFALFEGQARAIVASQVHRFDAAANRFVRDEEFVRLFPDAGEGTLIGRFVRTPQGRLWFGASNRICIYDTTVDPPRALPAPSLPNMRPYYLVAQDDGVIWMHREHQLVRYDPAFPDIPAPPLRALVTRVQLAADNRTLLPRGERLPPIPFVSNSLVFHFAAPGAALGAAVRFETRLEGASDDWVAAGSAGSAAFTRLKEGRYVLHVRPSSHGHTGEEAQVAFEILPPWYRTTVAYAAYVLSLLGLVGFIAWLGSFLERREKQRLEKVVAARTAELHESNRRLVDQMGETTRKATELQASEERYRRLNEELEHRVAERTAELDNANHALRQANVELQAGVREIEAFSYSISHDLRAPLRNISGFAELLHKHLHGRLDPSHAHFLEVVSGESIRLGQLIDGLLAFSRLNRAELTHAPCDLAAIIAAVREELRPMQAERSVDWRIGPLPTISGDAQLLRQVFANLLANALKFTRLRSPAVIEIGTVAAAPGAAEHIVFVRDNGAGFDPKYTDKLFGVFQRLHRTTEFEGTGIGLANVRRIVARHGGRVWAEGHPNEGATFFVALPVEPPPSS